MSALDAITARNNTAITIAFNGQRVGRIQQFSESQANNVQVFGELGRDYMIEMQKGMTAFTFSISSFYVRNDVMDTLRGGAVFGLVLTDGAGVAETIDTFQQCMITSLNRSYSSGAVTVGQDASVVALGKGKLGTS